VALYAYAHLPERFKAQRRILAAELPAPAAKLALLELAIRELTAAGYCYIGMDHFALPGDPLAKALYAGALQRNFQGYSTHGDCDLVGLGMSAIGHVDGCFAQNTRDLAGYYERLSQGRLPIVRGVALGFDDVLRADVIQSVMCRNRLDFSAVEHDFGIRFDEYFGRELVELGRLAGDGLVQLGEYGFTVTPRGRLLLRVVAMVFDASLRRIDAASPRYSRVI
jgi:oxygen-independent coproporphyrinogen-3 oxidase